jgi:hypothetical protein
MAKTAPPPADGAAPAPESASRPPAASMEAEAAAAVQSAPPTATEAAAAAPAAEAEPAPPAEPAAAAEPETPAAEGGVFEFVDETPHTYTPRDHPPQTAELGDVCRLPFTPTDGRWIPTTKDVTRLPDPAYAEGEPDWDNVATSIAAHQANLERLGLMPKGVEQR